MVQAKLAIAKSFLEAYSRLPKAQQRKVRELTEKFQDDPTRSSLNFERIKNIRDDKVRSLRVDLSYRMIVVQAPRGDVLLAVWVDHHDEAYEWAAKKSFEINPVSGVLQVYTVVEEASSATPAPPPSTARKRPESPRGLVASVDDEQLLFAGVPLPLLAAVRALQTEQELDALAPHLPEDAADMLYLLAAGYPFQDALEEASRPSAQPARVDTEDFAAALDRPVSQGTFRVVDGEAELERMLDAPMEQWRVFLHPSQQRLVRQKANGPMRVLGGAGTGKTVVLMHRAKYLAEEVFTGPEDRLFVTTFTKNLATDLASALATLCPESMDRIEVKNLHAWAWSFYEKQLGGRIRVIQEEDERRALMEQATANAKSERFDVAFYMEEWDQVVQSQDVASETDYLKAKRVGRGTPLSRAQRVEVWRVLARYRESLESRGKLEWQDVIRESTRCLESGRAKSPYRAVLADEVQDFTPGELRLLRALAPRAEYDLFLVGDAHQRIYGSMARLGPCGIEIRGRSRRLRLNYRTTEQIRTRAVAILENLEVDDLDDGLDTLKGYRSLRSGPTPEVHHCARPEDEQRIIQSTLERWLETTAPEDICIAARTNSLLDRYARTLEAADFKVQRLKAEAAPNGRGIRLATMHRLKGLEFKKVLICGVQKGDVPLELPGTSHGDDASAEDHLKRERCLFYVAATRARDELVVTGAGQESPVLARKAP